mgnify:CR=1 FL=1
MIELLLGLATIFFIAKKKSSSISNTQPTYIPPKKIPANWEELENLSLYAEEISNIPNLRDFLIATFYRESKGVATAYNTNNNALGLFCEDWNYNGRYKNNPYKIFPCNSEFNKNKWGKAAGLSQMMPATALNNPYAYNLDPDILFDPYEHIPLAIDYIVRLTEDKNNTPYFGDIRAAWWYPSLLNKPFSDSKKSKSLSAFKKSISDANEKGLGINPQIPDIIVNVNDYPGYDYVRSKFLELKDFNKS